MAALETGQGALVLTSKDVGHWRTVGGTVVFPSVLCQLEIAAEGKRKMVMVLLAFSLHGDAL